MSGLTAALAAFVHQPGWPQTLPDEAVRIIKTGFAWWPGVMSRW